MNPCRALQFCYLSEGKRVCLSPGQWRRGGNLFWGFGVITFCFGGGRARGWGFVSGSFIWGAGSREEAHLSGQNWGVRVLDLDSSVMEGEREPRRI